MRRWGILVRQTDRALLWDDTAKVYMAKRRFWTKSGAERYRTKNSKNDWSTWFIATEVVRL